MLACEETADHCKPCRPLGRPTYPVASVMSVLNFMLCISAAHAFMMRFLASILQDRDIGLIFVYRVFWCVTCTLNEGEVPGSPAAVMTAAPRLACFAALHCLSGLPCSCRSEPAKTGCNISPKNTLDSFFPRPFRHHSSLGFGCQQAAEIVAYPITEADSLINGLIASYYGNVA